MNSIASMEKKPPSREAMQLAAAFNSSGMTKAALAKHMGVSDGMVSQWVSGHRPVPPDKAPKLGKLLDIAPERISAKYAQVAEADVGNVAPLHKSWPSGEDERRPDLVIARLENDVDSLRYALAAMVSVMAIHRPAEGADVAKAIRKHVPAKFVKQGYLAELLKALGAPE